jgi:protocatechuate 3,4-dioxygenase beta subunit
MKSAYLVVTIILAGLYPDIQVLAEQRCQPTPERGPGTHYIPNVAKLKKDLGKGLVVHGRVLSSTDCKPIANAVIEHWQAGDSGEYEIRLRAFSLSLPDGSYLFETEWPNISPPHIHFIVTAENHGRLVTQWIPDEKTDHASFNLVLRPALAF